MTQHWKKWEIWGYQKQPEDYKVRRGDCPVIRVCEYKDEEQFEKQTRSPLPYLVDDSGSREQTLWEKTSEGDMTCVSFGEFGGFNNLCNTIISQLACREHGQ